MRSWAAGSRLLQRSPWAWFSLAARPSQNPSTSYSTLKLPPAYLRHENATASIAAPDGACHIDCGLSLDGLSRTTFILSLMPCGQRRAGAIPLVEAHLLATRRHHAGRATAMAILGTAAAVCRQLISVAVTAGAATPRRAAAGEIYSPLVEGRMAFWTMNRLPKRFGGERSFVEHEEQRHRYLYQRSRVNTLRTPHGAFAHTTLGTGQTPDRASPCLWGGWVTPYCLSPWFYSSNIVHLCPSGRRAGTCLGCLLYGTIVRLHTRTNTCGMAAASFAFAGYDA